MLVLHLLLAASLARAQHYVAFSSPSAARQDLLRPGPGSALRIFESLATACTDAESPCDTMCMSSDGACCGLGNGSYCDAGFVCGRSGCCRAGFRCGDDGEGTPPPPPPPICAAGKSLCGSVCMPSAAACCDDAVGTWCGDGLVCGAGGRCQAHGDERPVNASSSADGGEKCAASHRACGTGCIPATAVCCDNGFFCDGGETCAADGTCRPACKLGGGCSRGSLTMPHRWLAGLFMAVPLVW